MTQLMTIPRIVFCGVRSCLAGHLRAAESKPDIVFVLFDDMGWGQPPGYNPESALRTPHLDRLAQQGMRFTDAHSVPAVCTPPRYGVLTGRFPSRIGQFRVLTSYSPPIIPPTRMTVASRLKQHGYHTACVGKWHLGDDDAVDPEKKPFKEAYWKEFGGGPNEALRKRMDQGASDVAKPKAGKNSKQETGDAQQNKSAA